MSVPDHESAFGQFSADGREFVFTRFDPPRPWLNYAWNEQFLVAIDQRGRGTSLYRDPAGHRTVPIRDRLVFVKDVDSGQFWTVGWDPVQLPFEHYECRHGLGLTTLRCTVGGIVSELRITAAAGTAAELWELTVKNTGATTRRLAVYPAVEFDLGGWTPYGTVENYSVCRRVGDRLLLALNQSDERPQAKNHAWFAASRAPDHYETRKREFIGGPYAALANPAGIRAAALTDQDAATEEFIGAFQYDLELPPGGTWVIHLGAGVAFDTAEAEALAATVSAAEFNRGLEAARRRTAAFERISVELPDPRWTQFFNVWAKQQLALLKDFTRVYLIGFRDTLQDVQALCAYTPAGARALLCDTLAHQFQDGSAMRGWCPDDHHKYADSGVWIPFAVGEWLRETGDFAVLEAGVPYRDGGVGSVWEHQLRALRWFNENLGSHGLPKLYFGDWNDSLNIGREGRGESVWLALALLAALKETAAIADHLADSATATLCRQQAQALADNLERHAWDGEWYLRGFADDGSPVGGHDDAEGRIFAEPQSWAVIAGHAPERWDALAASVDRQLRTPAGLRVCHPPFTHYQKRLGRISCLPPGWGENGSCYCHVTAFQAVADCLRRDGDAALASLTSILPFNPGLGEAQSWLEPYALSNMFRGPEHARPGATFKGWTSGTVPWALRGLTHYLLGVRPEFHGLRIDPVLPASWQGARMTRSFRGAVYEIQIANFAAGVRATECRLQVDGQPYPGSVLACRDFPSGTHHVQAEIHPRASS
jgi:cellobiose phosphorylase